MGEQEPMFPIMQGPAIPWSLIAPYEAQAQSNHGQSLKQLARRGGLDMGEAVAIMSGKKWRDIKPVSTESFLDFIAKRTARAERRSAFASPGRTVTLAAEVILGGLRFDPGTYEIRRTDPPDPSEPAF